MEMKLNSLPSRTWNRLGINESFVAIHDTVKNHTPEADLNGQTVIWDPEAASDPAWNTIVSGVGSDMDTLTEGALTASIRSEEGTKMEKPILLNYHYQNGENASSRIRIHAAKNSEIRVLFVLRSENADDSGISAMQTKVIAEEGSRVILSYAELLGNRVLCLNDIGGICEANASIELTKLELGAKELYAGACIDLKGDASSFHAETGYHVLEGQKIDMNYDAVHHGRKTESLMEINGTLEKGAKKAFRGTIDFKQGCAGSVGTENENVLLLSDDIVNQTIPLILCREEDVEGNHGASIGKLDDQVLFYLGTRGIDEKEAERMIAESRIDAICAKLPDEALADEVHKFEEKRRNAL